MPRAAHARAAGLHTTRPSHRAVGQFQKAHLYALANALSVKVPGRCAKPVICAPSGASQRSSALLLLPLPVAMPCCPSEGAATPQT